MKAITNISCVGAGLIGQGWATQFCSSGFDLILYDVNEAVLEKAMVNIKSNLMFLEAHELLGKDEGAVALKKIKTTCDFAEAVGNADYIQESVFDTYDIKKQIFKKMDALAPRAAILASSSSGLLMTEIQKAVTTPDRCLLAHPYLPVHLMPLVEVVGGRQTTVDTLTATCHLMGRVGKTPIQLQKEVPGYIVNRLQSAVLREALDLVDCGVASAEEVDKAFRLSLGLRGPFLGPLLRAHLAGEGIERFFENYSESYRIRWESMATWDSLSSQAAGANIKSIKEMEIVRTKSLAEIKAWRDEMLVKIIKAIHEGTGDL
jgi:3-hydroxypropionate dehydrogenase (NADP+)